MRHSDPKYSLLSSFGIGSLPHHFLCQCVYEATRSQYPAWKNWLIQRFVNYYQVNLDEACLSDIQAFTDFNAFFTRELKPGARTFDLGKDTIISPADGYLSEFGAIENGQLLQAKGRRYTLQALLADDAGLTRQFMHGHYLTVYLSPRDYHRVHMPVAGQLREMVHVPGRLFSVNANSAASVNRLFARNERVISIFDTHMGAIAVILVGALFVGNIEQTWAGQVAPGKDGEIKRVDYTNENFISIAQGVEMGRFNMGSTVIVLLENSAVDWMSQLNVDQPLRLGQALAAYRGF